MNTRALIIASLFFAAVAPSRGFAAGKQKVQVTDIKGSIAFMCEGSIKSVLKKQKNVEMVSSGAAVQVTANTERSAKGWFAEISVRSGDKVLKSWTAKGKEIRKLTQAIEKNMWKQLGPTILKAAPAEASAPVAGDDSGDDGEAETAAPAKEPAKESTPVLASNTTKTTPATTTTHDSSTTEASTGSQAAKQPTDLSGGSGSSSGTHTRSTSPFLATLGVNFFTRSLRYTDDLFGELRPYTLSGAPAPVLDVALYPGGFATDGFAAHVGLGVHVEYALALKSKDNASHEFPTSELELFGGLRGRIPLGSSEVTLSAGAGTHSFSIDNAGDGADPDVPGVSYTFLRVGLDARFAIVDWLNVTLLGAYRPVLSAGEIKEDAWFKNAKAGAIDAGVRIAYEVVPSVDIVVGGDMRRYFYKLNPEPGDARIAGGALDQYLSGTLAIGWHLR